MSSCQKTCLLVKKIISSRQGTNNHVRITNLTSGYRLRVHSPSLKKARSPSRIECPYASVQTPCQGQHFLLCHPALSNAFFVCEVPPSCLGLDSQVNMILPQNHCSRNPSCLVCDCRAHPDRCEALLCKEHPCPETPCCKVCHLEIFKNSFGEEI